MQKLAEGVGFVSREGAAIDEAAAPIHRQGRFERLAAPGLKAQATRALVARRGDQMLQQGRRQAPAQMVRVGRIDLISA